MSSKKGPIIIIIFRRGLARRWSPGCTGGGGEVASLFLPFFARFVVGLALFLELPIYVLVLSELQQLDLHWFGL